MSVVNTNGDLYYYQSPDQAHMNVETGSTTTIDMRINMHYVLGRAFQISQAAITARDFAWNMMGHSPSSVSIQYPSNGCYYNNSSNMIHIAETSTVETGMPKPYASWDVIMHEYGHHISYELDIIQSLGGTHYFSNSMIDHYALEEHTSCNCANPGYANAKIEGMRLAWSEGWATAFSFIAQQYWKNHLINIFGTCDTIYHAYNMATNYDVETTSIRKGDGCELSIIAVLWDVYDYYSEDDIVDEPITIGFQSWWNVTTSGHIKTFSEFVNNFYSTYPQHVEPFGRILTYYNFAPRIYYSTAIDEHFSTVPPVFMWFGQGGSTYFPNDSYTIKIISEFGDNELSISTINTQIELSVTQWDTVLSWSGETIKVTVAGYQTYSQTTGGYYSDYKTYTKPVFLTQTVDNEVIITGTYSPLRGIITIPETIDNKPVVGIGAMAFRNQSQLTGISLPNTVRFIGNRAFQFCNNLTNINMSQTLVTRIEDYTFDSCSLATLKLPQTVNYIGEGAFIRAGKINYIPEVVTHIGAYAFAYTSVTDLIINSNVTNIGANAFLACDSLTIYTSYNVAPTSWSTNWNYSNRPVVWGCTLNTNYIVSFTKSINNPSNTINNDISNPTRQDYKFEGWYTTSNFSGTKYSSINSAPNGILYAKWKKSCVAAGTLITLADGSQVAVESLVGDEQLLVWNFYTGSYDIANLMYLDYEQEDEYEIIELSFSDHSKLKIIDEHALWDITLNQYVYMRDDASQYIGHWFKKQSRENNELISYEVQLIAVNHYTEITSSWSPVTYGHLCLFVNGLLSIPGEMDGLINIFDVDPALSKYDENAMLDDINTYGLFTYEEFNEIIPIPEIVFNAFNGQYLKVSIGKGLITYDRLRELINRYSYFWNC